jgi:hypothetical protein
LILRAQRIAAAHGRAICLAAHNFTEEHIMQSTRVRLDRRHRASLAVFATCLLSAASTHAHTFCAGNAAAIQAALDAASDGGANDNENNTIEIAIGTYSTANNGNSEFFYNNQTTARVLDINGGYNSDCSAITENPALTILDGGGATRVFESESASGDVSLRFLTFQNGNVGTNQSGAGVEMNPSASDNGPVIFDQNIVRNNHTAYADGGFFIKLGGSGTLQFENNLVVGNSAAINVGAGAINDDGSGANIINNTFTQNTVTNMPASATGGLYFFAPNSSDTMSNNIFWGNSGFDLDTTAVLVNNDYGSDSTTPDPTSSGNVSVDPQFSSSTDFHLLPTSPLLGIGTLTPSGGLPSIDIEGHSRKSLDNKVDMGAYERGNEIFKDGFED